MTKFKKKPTIREISNVVFELSRRITSVMGLLSELEKAFSLYIEMKKDGDKYTKFINKKVKEWKANDTEKNGKIDTSNIPTNTKNEGSGTEGIRKESK